MNAEGKTEFTSVDDLLSADLDDLADLPSFETPPAGAYILEVTMDVKPVNGKDAVEASIVVVETTELADKEATPVVAGTKFSQLFMLDNEYGVGNLKKFLKPFAAHFGTSKIGELVRDHIKGVTISAIVKNRKDKNDPDKVYGSLTEITVA